MAVKKSRKSLDGLILGLLLFSVVLTVLDAYSNLGFAKLFAKKSELGSVLDQASLAAIENLPNQKNALVAAKKLLEDYDPSLVDSSEIDIAGNRVAVKYLGASDPQAEKLLPIALSSTTYLAIDHLVIYLDLSFNQSFASKSKDPFENALLAAARDIKRTVRNPLASSILTQSKNQKALAQGDFTEILKRAFASLSTNKQIMTSNTSRAQVLLLMTDLPFVDNNRVFPASVYQGNAISNVDRLGMRKIKAVLKELNQELAENGTKVDLTMVFSRHENNYDNKKLGCFSAKLGNVGSFCAKFIYEQKALKDLFKYMGLFRLSNLGINLVFVNDYELLTEEIFKAMPKRTIAGRNLSWDH